MLPFVLSFACVAYVGFTTAHVTTAAPSLSVAFTNALPTRAALPPKQAWCPSEIFCVGELLQTVNIAHLYPDDKIFVDKPTSKPAQDVLENFQSISSSATYGEVVQFVENNFREEGLELEGLELANFKSDPAFLNNVTAPIVKAFAQTVHSYWKQLVRGTNTSTLCTVPGGRFREQYYWDSFWIVEGLIESELYDIVNATLQNFMDELDNFGFIPNGGRTYYLNRSQPPLFIQMLWRYVIASGDRAILKRALPLAEKELKWWDANRSLQVRSVLNVTHKVYHYSASNSAPRPESYLTDFMTANLSDMDDTQKAALYAELASGAESGWDYTIRWFAPTADGSHDGIRSLKVRSTIPVDLNSILYRDHILLANLYGRDDPETASAHRQAAAALHAAILDLLWDPAKLAFYDYNLDTRSRNNLFSAANFYPLWSGIIPPELLSSSEKAFGHFSSLNLALNRYNGTFPSTFIVSGQQWDAPNAWPPHQYIILQALHINKLNGTVLNGGNATDGEGWAKALERQLANRYIASAFCSWRATGGSIDGVLPRLSPEELNVTQSVNNTGNMFEKFSNVDIDSAGRGGEYTVQVNISLPCQPSDVERLNKAGFGWTNGVLLWVSSLYGGMLVEPECPNLLTRIGTVRLTKNRPHAVAQAVAQAPMRLLSGAVKGVETR
ncbi:Trehalase [Termitomyces sp. J132]|nr:Trehalase [Termitomyces sp. J132]